jgi:hypothetical protein
MDQTPSLPERARSIAARHGLATIVPAPEYLADTELRISPHVYYAHPDGSITLLIPENHELVSVAWHLPVGELTAMVEITDAAPVSLREPVRGLLWISGVLSVLDGHRARTAVVDVAEQHPDPRLLDAGHGMAVLRLHPTTIVVADGESSGSVTPAEFAMATADPFCGQETMWLRHLESNHRDIVGQLSRHLPGELAGGHIRPLSLDRFGIRLRIETGTGDHDIRLPFQRSVDTPAQLGRELRQLVGCPFLAATQPS